MYVHIHRQRTTGPIEIKNKKTYNTCLTLIKKDLDVKYSIIASFLEIQIMPLKTTHAPSSHRLKGLF